MYFLRQVYELLWHLVHPQLLCLERLDYDTVCIQSVIRAEILRRKDSSCPEQQHALDNLLIYLINGCLKVIFCCSIKKTVQLIRKKTGTGQRNSDQFRRRFFTLSM